MSVVAEAFGIPLSVAEREDINACLQVIEMRNFDELKTMEEDGDKIKPRHFSMMVRMEKRATGELIEKADDDDSPDDEWAALVNQFHNPMIEAPAPTPLEPKQGKPVNG